MSKTGTKSIFLGAILGGVVGAILGAVIATRRSTTAKSGGPTVTDVTGISMSALALSKQIIDAFS